MLKPESSCNPAGDDVAKAKQGVHILAFSTSNYDAMLKFFWDFGFEVIENPGPLVPMFEHGRGAIVQRGDFEFQLEESKLDSARACFNLFLTDFPDEEIEKRKAMGYTCDYESWRHTHTFRMPDGGSLSI